MANKVILVGNLGKDPELKYTQSGQPVTSFSVATVKKWKAKDGNMQEKTTWHNIVVWGKQAESCASYLSKGKKVYVEGEIDNRSWDDKNTGQKKYITEIIANNIEFLSPAGQQQGQQGQQQRPQGQGWSQNQQRPQPQQQQQQQVPPAQQQQWAPAQPPQGGQQPMNPAPSSASLDDIPF